MSARILPGARPGPKAWLAAAGFCAAAALLLAACPTGAGRFATCKSDADCAARDTAKQAPACVSLRCVPCRSDAECPTGEACNSANECHPFTEARPSARPSAEPIEKESWEASTPEDREKCLAACKGKGKECTDRCGGGKPPPKK